LIKLAGGYYANNLNKMILVSFANDEQNSYFIALRHSADKWVLMKFEEEDDEKIIVKKNKYIIKTLDGFEIESKEKIVTPV
jgi:phosphoribosyl-ATP pyrophosphohydrolase